MILFISQYLYTSIKINLNKNSIILKNKNQNEKNLLCKVIVQETKLSIYSVMFGYKNINIYIIIYYNI